MADSYVEYTADGVGNDFTVTFPYLKKSHVALFVDGVADLTFTWIDATSIAATSLPANNAEILISRTTPRDALVYEIPNSGTYKGADLNNQALQALYIAAEGYDALENTISLDTGDNKWDADTKAIKGVVDPVADQDVATKNYADTSGSSILGQATTAATAAAASESNAATSESNADTDATTATTQAGNAATSETNASTSAGTATTQASNASDSADDAEAWANTAEDTLVPAANGGDEVDDYSALHFANKAADSATAADVSATAAAASVSGLSLPESARNANELLRGEDGIACHFLARDYRVIDYTAAVGLNDGPAQIIHNSPLSMNTDTLQTVTNRAGGSEALSANEMTWDHSVASGIVTPKGVDFDGGNHTMSLATIGSTFNVDMDNMTIYVELEQDVTTGDQDILEFYTTAATTDGYRLRMDGGTVDWDWYETSSLAVSQSNGAQTVSTTIRTAATFKGNGQMTTIATGGGIVDSSTGLTFPATATDLRLGNGLAGWIRKFAIYSRSFSDDELALICGITL